MASKALAVRAFPGFLLRSEKILCLVDGDYLSRTWCVYELAAFAKLRPTGKIVMCNVYQCLLIFWCLLLDNMNDLMFAPTGAVGYIYRNVAAEFRMSEYKKISNWIFLGGSVVTMFIYYILVKFYVESRDRLVQVSKTFDVRNTTSTDPEETLVLMNSIGTLFASHDNGDVPPDLLEEHLPEHHDVHEHQDVPVCDATSYESEIQPDAEDGTRYAASHIGDDEHGDVAQIDHDFVDGQPVEIVEPVDGEYVDQPQNPVLMPNESPVFGPPLSPLQMPGNQYYQHDADVDQAGQVAEHVEQHQVEHAAHQAEDIHGEQLHQDDVQHHEVHQEVHEQLEAHEQIPEISQNENLAAEFSPHENIDPIHFDAYAPEQQTMEQHQTFEQQQQQQQPQHENVIFEAEVSNLPAEQLQHENYEHQVHEHPYAHYQHTDQFAENTAGAIYEQHQHEMLHQHHEAEDEE